MKRILPVVFLLLLLMGCQENTTEEVTTTEYFEPSIELVGEQEIYLEVNTEYQELGAEAFLGEDDLSVSVNGEVNTSSLGTYTIIYSASAEGFQDVQITRTIHVIDSLAPSLTYTESEEFTIEYGEEFDLSVYYEISDNYDLPEDLTVTLNDEINLETLGTQSISLTIADSSGNLSQSYGFEITIIDSVKPTISLSITYLEIEIGSGQTLRDFVTMADNYDSNENIELIPNREIDYGVLGYNMIFFYAVDSSGNQSSPIACTVAIVDTISPTLEIINTTPIVLEAGIDPFPLDYFEYSDNYNTTEEIKLIIENYDDLPLGTTIVNVYAEDSSGNRSDYVVVNLTLTDNTAPIIGFSELDDFTQEMGTPFTNQCLVLYDNFDDFEDITLIVDGEVDVNTLGDYEMSYYAIDSNGNQSITITKTVTVVEREELDYYERYMKDHTSLYDPVKFTNTYLYDVIEKCYRGLVLNHEGEYEVVYFFFLYNYYDGHPALSKIEFVNPNGDNDVYVLNDEEMNYVFRIPIEFVNSSGTIDVKTYPHADNPATVAYWKAAFSFNNLNNLDPEYLLTLNLRQGNLK